MMEFFGGPAALGGIMMCVALGAWTLGRWQGGLALPEDRGSQDRAGTQDPAVSIPGPSPHAVADPLGELHADISAYRRAQQVLADVDHAAFALTPPARNQQPACRQTGLTGAPVCSVGEAMLRACEAACHAGTPLPQRCDQPSAAASGALRV